MGLELAFFVTVIYTALYAVIEQGLPPSYAEDAGGIQGQVPISDICTKGCISLWSILGAMAVIVHWYMLQGPPETSIGLEVRKCVP